MPGEWRSLREQPELATREGVLGSHSARKTLMYRSITGPSDYFSIGEKKPPSLVKRTPVLI